MFMTRLTASGLAVSVDLDPMARIADVASGAQATTAADALSLWKAALVGPAALAALQPLQLDAEPAAPIEDEAPRYDLWNVARAGVNALLDHDVNDVLIDVSITPDPPLYGRLREHAVRDPRLLTALGQQAEMHVKVGWRFTHDRTFATSDVLGARIGDVSFPLSGKERPAWLDAFLQTAAARITRVDLEEDWSHTLALLHGAALSPLPSHRSAWARLANALRQAPFELDALSIFVDGDRQGLAVGEGATTARHLDRAQRDGVRLAAATLLVAPDVLVVPTQLPTALREWLDSCTQGDDATLEQAIRP